MDNLQAFMAYAGDFEKTLADDDWSRLGQYFTDDAVYVVEGGGFGCRLEGPTGIFAGMKKSLDGMDRKFDSRDLELTDGPHVDGDRISMSWKVIYHLAGQEDFILPGRSDVVYRDGRIAELTDSYEPEVAESALAWQQASGMTFDPSYT